MDKKKLRQLWKDEESFPFKGWNFSHLSGRYTEEDLPWDYRQIVRSQIRPGTVLLDMGTGGGEFLLSLAPPPGRTYATEGYAPNIELARAALAPRGIELRAAEDDSALPFDDCFFSLVINRHEAYSLPEVYRILKHGGMFITQQVGERNNRNIAEFLLGEAPVIKSLPENLRAAMAEAEQLGFDVLEQQEHFPQTRYYDVGALVYMAKIIVWEFPGFSVERCFDKLLELQEEIESKGYITSAEHRYLLALRKE